MELMDIIKARHSIRKYTEKQISRDDLEKFWKQEILHQMQAAGREACWLLYIIRN